MEVKLSDDQNNSGDEYRDDMFVKSKEGQTVLITLASLSFLCLVLGIYNTILMHIKQNKKKEL